MTIEQIIDLIYPLSKAAKGKLISVFTEITFPKNYLLSEYEKHENYFYFIKNGLVRAYAIQEDRELTFWFGKDGDPALSMYNYILNRPSYETIDLIEDSTFYFTKISQLEQLYLTDIEIANWGRKFAEIELLKTEERAISRQIKSAKERYIDLLEKDPYLLNRVPLKYIASFLGVTQVSLSRIRSEFLKK
ncbi:Crp/Fnr family transcriptional regulator [Myroides odoratimimus]|uniref:Crp/Fnr family transcriptional regulator n=1 Tax=Myroides odoratimimus TaxID=76832 RepID=UPI002576DF8F|nr:Crp/Fnr family transcriptional regulator [Myroides odoratimimus]MDM1397877.1 Crp/Fnr family transcriptional regulator [Myroides odoratimimus]